MAESVGGFHAETALAALRHQLKLEGKDIVPVAGGTLGVGFQVEIDGHPRYLKTYVSDGKGDTLTKEHQILALLYSDSLHTQLIEVTEPATTRLWLVMDILAPLHRNPTPSEVLAVVDAYSSVLGRVAVLPGDGWDDFDVVVREGKRALETLSTNHFLSRSVELYCRESLVLLEREASGLPLCLCHGDLSSNNIMLGPAGLVAIDWEDAFWGIEGYDYLYWLTFLQNRSHVSQESLSRGPWSKEMNIAIFLLIVLVKNEISFLSGKFKENAISFDERLMDAISLA